MHSSHRLWALLLAAAGVVRASPTPVAAAAVTSTAFNTDAWVSVGSDGIAKTITPVMTFVSGVLTVVDASPTTSGTATTTAQPEATATNGGGSFPVCSNVDGDLAPFCAPSDRSTLNPGETYYITWDTAFFSKYPNTSVILTGNLYNETTGEVTTQAFSSNTLAAGWSFYAWNVDKALLDGASSKGVNISISMSYLSVGNSSTHIRGPVVRVAKPEPYRQPPAELPSGAALYIGLPCVFAFIVIMVVGTSMWNRHHRKIDVGSAMGRSRFSKLGGKKGYGVGRSRRQRTGAVNLDSKDAILLQSREAHGGASGSHDDDDYDEFGMSRPLQYSDSPREAEARHQNEYHKNNKTGAPTLTLSEDWAAPERPRRDSDALGSLAGTPTEDHFSGDHRPRTAHGENGATGNAFRDELRRQNDRI